MKFYKVISANFLICCVLWTDQNHFPVTAALIVWQWCGSIRWNWSLHLVHLLCFSNHQWDMLEIYLLSYYCWCAGNESSLKVPLNIQYREGWLTQKWMYQVKRTLIVTHQWNSLRSNITTWLRCEHTIIIIHLLFMAAEWCSWCVRNLLLPLTQSD